MKKELLNLKTKALCAILVLLANVLPSTAQSGQFDLHYLVGTFWTLPIAPQDSIFISFTSCEATGSYPQYVESTGRYHKGYRWQYLALDTYLYETLMNRELRWIEMLAHSVDGYGVFPYAVFKNSAARDAFLSESGRLPWETLTPGDPNVDWDAMMVPVQEVPWEYRNYCYYKNYSGSQRVLLYHPQPTEGHWVMGRTAYQKNAIAVKAELATSYRLYADSTMYSTNSYPFDESGACNVLNVTYTNTASYPVVFEASAPAIDPGSDYDTQTIHFEHWVDGSSAEIGWQASLRVLLLPNETRTLAWGVKLCTDEKENKSRLENAVLNIVAQAEIITMPPSLLNKDICKKTLSFKLPGYGTNFFSMEVYPLALGYLDENKILNFSIQRFDRLVSMKLYTPEGEKDVPLTEFTRTGEGSYTFSLYKYVNEPGVYHFWAKDDKDNIHTKAVSVTYGSLLAAYLTEGVNTLRIGQHAETKKFQVFQNYHYTPTGYNTILSFSGLAEASGNDILFKEDTRINGLLKVSNAPVRLQIAPDKMSLLPETQNNRKSIIHYSKGDKDYALTTEGDFKIETNSQTLYSPVGPTKKDGVYGPHQGVLLDFLGTKKLDLGDFSATTPGAYLYSSAVNHEYISLTGNAKLDVVFPFPLDQIFTLDGNLNVYDARLNRNGFSQGYIRADGTGRLQVAVKPIDFILFDGNANVDMDLIDQDDGYFDISGNVSIGPVGGLSGRMRFEFIGQETVPQIMEAKLESNMNIPLFPPVLYLKKAGFKANGIAQTIKKWNDNADVVTNLLASDLNFSGEIGLNFVEFIDIAGKATVSSNYIGISDVSMGIWKLSNVLNNGRMGVSIPRNAAYKGVTYPDVEVEAGGTLSLLGVFNLGVEGRMNFMPTRLIRLASLTESEIRTKINGLTYWYDLKNIRGWTEDYLFAGVYLYNSTHNPTIISLQAELGNSGKELLISDALKWRTFSIEALNLFNDVYKNGPSVLLDRLQSTNGIDGKNTFNVIRSSMMEAEMKGEASITIPSPLPFAGTKIAGASVSVDLFRVEAVAEVSVNVSFTIIVWDIDIEKNAKATIAYYWDTDWEGSVETKSSEMREAGGIISSTGQFRMPAFAAMVKDTDVHPNLRVFSDEFSHTKTQTMQDLSRAFAVNVRSKKANAGLKLTGPDNQIVSIRTASDLNWLAVEDEDYFQATVYMELPTKEEAIALGMPIEGAEAVGAFKLTGEWKMEAYTADGSAFDPDGLIDCDFFYAMKTAAIENLQYDYNPADQTGTLDWTNKDLDEDGTYRISVSIINANDEADRRHLLSTTEWTPEEEVDSYNISGTMLQNIYSLISGDYLFEVSLEKLVDVNEENIPMWSTQDMQSTQSFTYVKLNEPLQVSNLSVSTGNGLATIRWNAPSDMERVSGYILRITDEEGNTTSVIELEKEETEAVIAASDPEYDYETGEYFHVSVRFDTSYTYALTTYREIQNDDESEGRIESRPAMSNPVSVPRPAQPLIALLEREMKGSSVIDKTFITSGISPKEMASMSIAASKEHILRIGSSSPIHHTKMLVSEELYAFEELHPDDDEQPAYTNRSSLLSFEGNDFIIFPLDSFEEGKYKIEMKIAGSADDYNIYSFYLIIDNTPPQLLVGTMVENEEGEWIIPGTTEPNATLSFNGYDVTSMVSNGIFTLVAAKDLSHISLEATDAAGNKTVISETLNGISSLPDGDLTSSIAIDFDHAELKISTTLQPVAEIIRNGLPMTPEADRISWSIVKGRDVIDIDSQTGLITPKAEGEARIMVTYLDVLKDYAEIVVADQFPISDLYVSEIIDKNKVRLSFTEPLDAESKTLELSSDSPVDGEVTSGWKTISATFDNNGNATVASLPADRTIYFRMKVTGGHNEGISNTAGRANLEISLVESIMLTIDNEIYQVKQSVANTEATVRNWLVQTINAFPIMGDAELTIASDDIAFAQFTVAIENTNGSFTFSVSINDNGSRTTTSLIEGTIIAGGVGIGEVGISPLQAVKTSDGLLIKGLTPGKTLEVYDSLGRLIHSGKPSVSEQEVKMTGHGIYIVVNNGNRIKAIY